ncbi:MAG: phosphatase PAP2 family protein [Fuerstiella sp.]|nr:phosphatase PAP2 family protein [Fuerstiella sp.]
MNDNPFEDSPPASLRPVAIALCITGIAWLAFEGMASLHTVERIAFERSWIEFLRDPQNPGKMIGPELFEESVRDLSALGGYVVVSTVIVCFATFGALSYGRPFVRLFLISVLGGYGCSMLLKLAFDRDRPSVVPHLSHVATKSFPSSHAMVSSIVYLSIGLLLAQRVRDTRIRALLVVVPLCLTGLVGSSRIAMGVHYPTDVLAGWAAGLLWVLVVFSLQSVILRGPQKR